MSLAFLYLYACIHQLNTRRFKKGYRNVIAEAQALNARGVDCQ